MEPSRAIYPGERADESPGQRHCPVYTDSVAEPHDGADLLPNRELRIAEAGG